MKAIFAGFASVGAHRFEPNGRKARQVLVFFAVLASSALMVVAGAQSSGTRAGEWRSYAGDLRNQHYSSLDQITAANFNNLEVAWRFKTDNLGPRPEYKLE